MAQAIDPQQQLSPKLTRFQEFVFVSDSALKLTKLEEPTSSHGRVSLTQAKIGDVVTIKQILAPQNIIRQLQNLKFKPKQKIQLVNKTDNGSVVVSINNTLIGIGKEIVPRIVVTLAGDGKL